eukprot:898063_1
MIALNQAIFPMSKENTFPSYPHFRCIAWKRSPGIYRPNWSACRPISKSLPSAIIARFLAAADTIQDANSSIQSMETKTDSFLQSVPRFESACDAFLSESREICAKRLLNRKVAENSSRIQELLELPQLMLSCVSSGRFEEALDLEEYVRALQLRHGHVDILNQLVSEMGDTGQLIVHEILRKLESEINLQKCLSSIGLLKRVQKFDENTLRMEFLARRQKFLSSQLGILTDERLQKMTNAEACEYLSNFMHKSRMYVFEIITHYRAIFVETSEASSEAYVNSNLLSQWATEWVSLLLDELARVLPRIREGSSLANTLEECMYCGLSLGHVGADFRGLIAPLFESHCLRLFDAHLSSACSAFTESLQTYDWHIAPEILKKFGVVSAKKSPAEENQSLPFPPPVLLEYPPLSFLANGFILAFNQLSYCAPLSISSGITDSLESHMVQLVSALQPFIEHSRGKPNLQKDGAQPSGTSTSQAATGAQPKDTTQVDTDPQSVSVSQTAESSKEKKRTSESAAGELIIQQLCQVLVDVLLPFVSTLFNSVY